MELGPLISDGAWGKSLDFNVLRGEQDVSRGWAAQGRQLELTVGVGVGSREEKGVSGRTM